MQSTEHPLVASGIPVEHPLKLNELAEVLVKHYGLKEGLFEPLIEFTIGVANVGPTPETIAPSAITSVTKIGLMKVARESANSVDASKIKTARKIATKKKD